LLYIVLCFEITPYSLRLGLRPFEITVCFVERKEEANPQITQMKEVKTVPVSQGTNEGTGAL